MSEERRDPDFECVILKGQHGETKISIDVSMLEGEKRERAISGVENYVLKGMQVYGKQRFDQGGEVVSIDIYPDPPLRNRGQR